MTFKDWLNIIKDEGLICDRYLPKVLSARSRKQYMDAVLNINGMSFLCDMADAGHKLPYEVIKSEFKAYLNGRYIATNASVSGAYTTAMYCGVNKPSEITVNTTLTGIFGCDCVVNIPSNTVAHLCVDECSKVAIVLGDNSKCHVDVWGRGSVSHIYGDRVIIKRKKYTHNE
jgi:hypothetical protein